MAASGSVRGSKMKDVLGSLKNTSATSTTTASARQPHNVPTERRIMQNFCLIWLDANINESNDDFRNSITYLRGIVNTINTFTTADECVDFLTDIKDEKALMIVSGALGQLLLPFVHEISQLYSIFVFCGTKARYERWAKDWSKVEGVYTDIGSICESLRQVARQCDQDTIPISFVAASETSSEDLDQLDQSFMYTQILKEILFELDYDEQSMKELTAYCRGTFINNDVELTKIIEFERDYQQKSPIWWYTYQCFLYSMLNRALRTQEVDTIINMGFFIRDLHEQIKTVHLKQFGGDHKPFHVYRGQGLSRDDFEKLMKTKGGLMSFNSFLSTSRDRDVSFAFAESSGSNPDLIGILFEMMIDSTVSTAPFALIRELSYYQAEEEILFSMHTVFRIGEIKKLDISNELWQVELKLTSDNDPLLSALTERMREETRGSSGWHRLGQLLIKLGQFDKAEEVYRILLDHPTSSTDSDKAHQYYHDLGQIKYLQGDYMGAILFYEESFDIRQKSLPSNHPDLAQSYNHMGSVYWALGNNSKALWLYENSLEIRQKTLPLNYPELAQSYNNIGSIHSKMAEYSKALSFYEQAIEIEQKTLPPNHPDLAISYINIGSVYFNMGENSKALSFYEKGFEIYQKSLPSYHPLLGTSYNNIGNVYDNMGEYSKALSFYEKALETYQKTLSPNHPDLATSYSNIGNVYDNMDQHSKALSFYEKAFEIYQKNLPSNHPSLAISYNNIGSVYKNMGEYSKALSFYEKSLDIRQETLPLNHPDLAQSHSNIGFVYYKMREYSKAFSFYKKALEIRQKILPPNHLDLATSHNNMGLMYDSIGEYSKALSSHEKTLEIRQKILPPNHLDLAQTYNNIGGVYYEMKDYYKALSFFERAVEIKELSLPLDHHSLQMSRKWLELVKEKLQLNSHE